MKRTFFNFAPFTDAELEGMSPAQPRTGDIEKLHAQLDRVNNANAVLKDTLVAFVQDHIQETIALRDYKRKAEIGAIQNMSLNTVEVCQASVPCGGCVECQLSQALQQLEKVGRELDALRHISGAAEDFVQNVNNHLIEGAGEMSLPSDASFRELRDAVNRHRKCEECGEPTDLANSEMIHGRIICDECKENSHTLGDAAIGREWRKNSSLEKWFPFAAARLAELEANEKQRLQIAMEKAVRKL